MEKIKNCRVCGEATLRPFFDLGDQPLANSLLSSPDEKEKFYPLSLSWCEKCNLVQLNETIDPKELFSTYVWVTGTSKTANEFAKRFYEELVVRAPNTKERYVLEIASNDGTFLKPFLVNGYEGLGIDPAQNIAEIAVANHVPTKCAFWGVAAARELVKEKGKAHIVFARNVLPHVANTRDFVEGLAESLSDDGVLAIETHYARIILEELHYDSIYHEHVCYFTLKTLERLLSDFGLFVFDIAKSPISGGSIIVYTKKKKVEESLILKEYWEKEREEGINNFEKWEYFTKRVFEHRDKLLKILADAGKSGKIVAWGASARSSTLLNFCGIDHTVLSSIIDLNFLKQGKFTAGTHIPILGPEESLTGTPHLVFITAWNFADEIMTSLRSKFKFKGPCLIPLPNDPRMVTSDK